MWCNQDVTTLGPGVFFDCKIRFDALRWHDTLTEWLREQTYLWFICYWSKKFPDSASVTATSMMHYTLCQPDMALVKNTMWICIPRHVTSIFSTWCILLLTPQSFCWAPDICKSLRTGFAIGIGCHQDTVNATMPYDQSQYLCWCALQSLCYPIILAKQSLDTWL